MTAYICPSCGNWGFRLDGPVWCLDCGAPLPDGCWVVLSEAGRRKAEAAKEGLARAEVERCKRRQMTLKLHTRGPLELRGG